MVMRLRFGSLLYPLVYAISSPMARIYRAVWRAGPDMRVVCRNRTMLRSRRYQAQDYVRMGFYAGWGVESMADGRGKPVAAIAYLCLGALFYDGWTQYFYRLFVGAAVLAGRRDAMPSSSPT